MRMSLTLRHKAPQMMSSHITDFAVCVTSFSFFFIFYDLTCRYLCLQTKRVRWYFSDRISAQIQPPVIKVA